MLSGALTQKDPSPRDLRALPPEPLAVIALVPIMTLPRPC